MRPAGTCVYGGPPLRVRFTVVFRGRNIIYTYSKPVRRIYTVYNIFVFFCIVRTEVPVRYVTGTILFTNACGNGNGTRMVYGSTRLASGSLRKNRTDRPKTELSQPGTGAFWSFRFWFRFRFSDEVWVTVLSFQTSRLRV